MEFVYVWRRRGIASRYWAFCNTLVCLRTCEIFGTRAIARMEYRSYGFARSETATSNGTDTKRRTNPWCWFPSFVSSADEATSGGLIRSNWISSTLSTGALLRVSPAWPVVWNVLHSWSMAPLSVAAPSSYSVERRCPYRNASRSPSQRDIRPIDRRSRSGPRQKRIWWLLCRASCNRLGSGWRGVARGEDAGTRIRCIPGEGEYSVA